MGELLSVIRTTKLVLTVKINKYYLEYVQIRFGVKIKARCRSIAPWGYENGNLSEIISPAQG